MSERLCSGDFITPTSFIPYKDEAEIEIGDVVIIKNDLTHEMLAHSAFMTSIVFDIDEEHGLVWLGRPHLRAKKVGCCRGDFSISIERHPVEKSAMVRSYMCYTCGAGKKDNRGEVI